MRTFPCFVDSTRSSTRTLPTQLAYLDLSISASAATGKQNADHSPPQALLLSHYPSLSHRDERVYSEDPSRATPLGYQEWLRAEAGRAHCWVSVLKWMLSNTMGAPEAFENRRIEMARSQNIPRSDVTDQQVSKTTNLPLVRLPPL